MDNKEPLRLWFPELNSFQITKVREFIREAEEKAYRSGFIQGREDALMTLEHFDVLNKNSPPVEGGE